MVVVEVTAAVVVEVMVVEVVVEAAATEWSVARVTCFSSPAYPPTPPPNAGGARRRFATCRTPEKITANEGHEQEEEECRKLEDKEGE